MAASGTRKQLKPDEKLVLTGNGYTTAPKIEAFDWKVMDEPGEFAMLPKSRLFIDHEYQRDKVNNERVLDIAARWSWMACGCLLVVRRGDKTLWVFDGQHRKLAADKRSDIKNLPCLVFASADKSKATEADGFVRANTVRTSVHAYELFRANLVRKEPDAVAVDEMVRGVGYTVVGNAAAGMTRVVACVATLLRGHKANPALTASALRLCVDLANGKPIIDRVFAGLVRLERYLLQGQYGTIMSGPFRDKLLQAGLTKILLSINDRAATVRKGGPKAWADGILDVLNEGVKRKKIPTIFLLPSGD